MKLKKGSMIPGLNNSFAGAETGFKRRMAGLRAKKEQESEAEREREPGTCKKPATSSNSVEAIMRTLVEHEKPVRAQDLRTKILEGLVKKISQGNEKGISFHGILIMINGFQEDITDATPEQKIMVLTQIKSVFCSFTDSNQIVELLKYNFKILNSFADQQDSDETKQEREAISKFWVDNSLSYLRPFQNSGDPGDYVILKIFSNPIHHDFLIKSILQDSLATLVAEQKLGNFLENGLSTIILEQQERQGLQLLLDSLLKETREKRLLQEIREAISEVSICIKSIISEKRSLSFKIGDSDDESDDDESDSKLEPKKDISGMIYPNISLYPDDYKDLLSEFLKSGQIKQESIEIALQSHFGQESQQIIEPIGVANVIESLNRFLLPRCHDLKTNRSQIRTFLVQLLRLVPTKGLDSDLTILLQEAAGIFGYKEILLQELGNLNALHAGDEYGEFEKEKLLSLIKIIESIDSSKVNKDEEILASAADPKQRSLVSKIRITESGIQANELRNAFLAEQIATIRSRIIASKAELNSIQSQEGDARLRLGQVDEDLKNELEKLECAQKKLRQFEERANCVKQERQAEKLRLEGELTRLGSELEELSKQISTANDELNGFRTAIQEAETLKTNLESKIANLESQKSQLEKEAKQLALEKEALEAENARLQKLNEDLSSKAVDDLIKARQAGLSLDELIKLADDNPAVTVIKGESDKKKVVAMVDQIDQAIIAAKGKSKHLDLPKLLPVQFYFESQGGDILLQRQIDEATHIKWDKDHQVEGVDGKKRDTMFSIVCVVGRNGEMKYSMVTTDERGVYRSFLSENEIRKLDQRCEDEYKIAESSLISDSDQETEIERLQAEIEKLTEDASTAKKSVDGLRNSLRAGPGSENLELFDRYVNLFKNGKLTDSQLLTTEDQKDIEKFQQILSNTKKSESLKFLYEQQINLQDINLKLKEKESKKAILQSQIAVLKYRPEKTALGDFYNTQNAQIKDSRKKLCVVDNGAIEYYQKQLPSSWFSSDKKTKHDLKTLLQYPEPLSPVNGCSIARRTDESGIETACVTFYTKKGQKIENNVAFLGLPDSGGLLIAVQFDNKTNEVKILPGFYNDYSLKNKVTNPDLIEDGQKAQKSFNIKAIAAVEQEDGKFQSSSALLFNGKHYERSVNILNITQSTREVHNYNTDYHQNSIEWAVPVGTPSYCGNMGNPKKTSDAKNAAIKEEICNLARFYGGKRGGEYIIIPFESQKDNLVKVLDTLQVKSDDDKDAKQKTKAQAAISKVFGTKDIEDLRQKLSENDVEIITKIDENNGVRGILKLVSVAEPADPHTAPKAKSGVSQADQKEAGIELVPLIDGNVSSFKGTVFDPLIIFDGIEDNDIKGSFFLHEYTGKKRVITIARKIDDTEAENSGNCDFGNFKFDLDSKAVWTKDDKEPTTEELTKLLRDLKGAKKTQKPLTTLLVKSGCQAQLAVMAIVKL